MNDVSSVFQTAALYTPHVGLCKALEEMIARVVTPGCKVEAGVWPDRVHGIVKQTYDHVALIEWIDENGNARRETIRLCDLLTRNACVEAPPGVARAIREIGLRQKAEIVKGRKHIEDMAASSTAQKKGGISCLTA